MDGWIRLVGNHAANKSATNSTGRENYQDLIAHRAAAKKESATKRQLLDQSSNQARVPYQGWRNQSKPVQYPSRGGRLAVPPVAVGEAQQQIVRKRRIANETGEGRSRGENEESEKNRRREPRGDGKFRNSISKVFSSFQASSQSVYVQGKVLDAHNRTLQQSALVRH